MLPLRQASKILKNDLAQPSQPLSVYIYGGKSIISLSVYVASFWK